jgi:gliding motility-associated-like protein
VDFTLTVFPPLSQTVDLTICQGTTFVFNDNLISTSGTYTDTLTSVAGCDSIVTLELTVTPALSDTIQVSICNGTTYNFNGVSLANSGTYTSFVSTAAGCDSLVVLELTVNPVPSVTIQETICEGKTFPFNGSVLSTAGTYADTLTSYLGCDSIVMLELTVSPALTETITDTICEGSTLNFNGILVGVTGTYIFSLSNASGCDSTVTLVLSVLPAITQTVSATICEGTSYFFNGNEITTAGTYTANFTTVTGCDSIVTLSLSVKPALTETVGVVICEGSVYNFNGTEIAVEGTYTDTITSFNGCDSIIELFLSIQAPAYSNITETICSGETYNFNGTILSVPGVYSTTLISSEGCDSTVTLNLTVDPIPSETITAVICQGESYNFNGTMLNASGTYTDGVPNSSGCTGVLTLNLTVLPTLTENIQASVCLGQFYDFNGTILTTPGTYTQTITSTAGCDSVVTLQLSIIPFFFENIDASICQGGSYSFGNNVLSTPGTYLEAFVSIAGCDSIVVLNLSVAPVSPVNVQATICEGDFYNFNGAAIYNAGTYIDTLTTTQGCDSIVYLTLTVLPIPQTVLNVAICESDSFLFDGTYLKVAGTYETVATGANGCDSTTTLQLSLIPQTQGFLDAALCGDEAFFFNGQWLANAGIFFDTLVNSMGCDSFVTLTLSKFPIEVDTVEATLCHGTSMLWNGELLSIPGSYPDTLQSIHGCDSIVFLLLDTLPPVYDYVTFETCTGDTLYWNEQVISSDGVYSDTFPSASGCDSIVQFQATFLPIYQQSIVASICEGGQFTVGNSTYSSQGVFVDTLTSFFGCDSLVTLTLNVLNVPLTFLNGYLCQGQYYDLNGTLYGSPGIYADTLLAVNGCDSIVVLDLSVLPSAFHTTSVVACHGESVVFNNTVYTVPGIYADTLTAFNGCDSIDQLDFSFLPLNSVQVQSSICQGDTYDFNGTMLDSTGIYVDTLQDILGCDSIITLLLTVNPLPVIQITGSNWLCEGQSLILSVTDPTQGPVIWFNGLSADSIVISSTGWFWASVTDTNGCMESDSFLVQAAPPAIADAGMDADLSCTGLPVIIGPVSPLPGSYAWSGPGIDTSNQGVSNPAVISEGVYTLVYTNEYGCTGTDTVLVGAADDYPTAAAGAQLFLTCQDTAVYLQGMSDTPNAAFLWTGPGIDVSNQHLPNPLIGTPGVYVLTVTDSLTGCQSAPDSVSVVANNTEPVIDIIADGYLNCYTSQVTLLAQSGGSSNDLALLWLDNQATIITNQSAISVIEPGLYTLLAYDSLTGCNSSANILLEDLMIYPVAAAGNPAQLNCFDTAVMLDGTESDSNANIVIQWTGPLGSVILNPNSLTPTVDAEGWYFLSVLDTVNGCINMDSVWVGSDFVPPLLDLQDSILLPCSLDYVMLVPTLADPDIGLSYLWTSDSAGMLLSPPYAQVAYAGGQGTYFLSVTNLSNGCSASDSTSVSVPPPVTASIMTVSSCAAQADGAIIFTDISGAAPPFNFTLNGMTMSIQPPFDGLSPGIYHVGLSDASSCTWDTTVYLPLFPPMEVSLGPDIFIQIGETVILDAQVSISLPAVASTEWSPFGEIPCAWCFQPEVQPFVTTTYSVVVTDTNGCQAADELIVYVNQNPQIYTPNAFSPNGDGINDVFVIYTGPEVANVRELRIFDRWGDNVYFRENFPPNDPGFGWDGTFREKPMDPAVFAFFTILELVDGSSFVFKGDITLVR